MTQLRPDLRITIDSAGLQRRIDELALISEAPAPVVTRVLFSEADQRGREYVRKAARDAGSKREGGRGGEHLRPLGGGRTRPSRGGIRLPYRCDSQRGTL